MKKFLLLSVLLLAVSSFANDFYHINTEPYWDGNITGGWLAQAQTFEAPANTDALVNWEFKLAGRTDPGQVTFNIFQWNSSGPVGDALFTQTLNWGTEDQIYDVTNINLALQPGQLYGAEIDLQGYSGQSVYYNGNETGYPGHDGWFYNPDFGGWNDESNTNQFFTADFSYVPEPSTLVLVGSSIFAVGFPSLSLTLYAAVCRR